MANLPMSQALASQFTTNLSKSLNLTPSQDMQARSVALTLASNPALDNCDTYSKVKYAYEAVRYGFGAEDRMYPVPYGGKIQAQVSYKGFREVALRTGKYRQVDASIVYECDKVVRDRNTGQIIVEFEENLDKVDETKIKGYFAFAVNHNGEVTSSRYMTVKQCEDWAKKYSKSYNKPNGIWKTQFNKMALKTVIKQVCGTLESSIEMQSLIKQDQKVYGGLNESDSYLDNPNVIDTEAQETTINNSIIEGEENDN